MNYSKLLFVLYLFIAFVKTTPVPRDLFNLDASFQEISPDDAPFDPNFDKEIYQDISPDDVYVDPYYNSDVIPESAPAEETKKGKNIFNDFFDKITNNVVGKDVDITTLVTDGVIQILKNNLCSLIQNEFKSVCNQLSETIINAISESLKGVIRASINTVTANSLSIACSVIPSEIFRNLSTVTIDSITKELGKMENVDAEKINRVTNNIITIIINTVENLLCAGKKADSIGNVIVNGIGDFASNIMDKINKMSNGKMSFNMNQNNNLANDFYEFQESLKDLLISSQSNEIVSFNSSF